MASDKQKSICGFTLIEVMASVVILLLIVLSMGKIFASTTKAYQETNKQAERDAAARAAMDFMTREPSAALFENPQSNPNALLTMRYEAPEKGRINFGFDSDEIWFVSGSSDFGVETNVREGVQITYFIQNYEGLTDAPENAKYRYALWRDSQAPKHGLFWNSYMEGQAGLDWSGSKGSLPSGPGNARTRRAVLLENVRTFEVFAYSDENGTRVSNWDSRGVGGLQPLFCMDIYLETMSEADAIRAAALAEAFKNPKAEAVVDFVESAVRRYYQRIYFPNKFAFFDHSYP